MKYKKFIIAGLVLLIFVLINILAIKLVYANKITGAPANFFAKLYNLKAGIIHEPDQDLPIYLSDYFDNVNFVNGYLEAKLKQEENKSTSTDNIFDPFPLTEMPDKSVIDKVIWDKLVKEAWVKKIAREKEISLTDDQIKERLDVFGDAEKIKKTMEDDYGLSFELYKKFLAEPAILEAEIYGRLIEDYQDIEGVQKIQEAWAWLEQGENFNDIAKKYSEDMSFIENTLWLTETDDSGLYDSVADLNVGDFSKIVQLPIGYVIWYVESEAYDEETETNAKEVRGIFVASKTFESFYKDYLSQVDIERKYNI